MRVMFIEALGRCGAVTLQRLPFSLALLLVELYPILSLQSVVYRVYMQQCCCQRGPGLWTNRALLAPYEYTKYPLPIWNSVGLRKTHG